MGYLIYSDIHKPTAGTITEPDEFFHNAHMKLNAFMRCVVYSDVHATAGINTEFDRGLVIRSRFSLAKKDGLQR